MTERMKVLFLPIPAIREPWQTAVVEAVGARHDLAIYEYDRPLAPQFEKVEVVIDFGGACGTRAMLEAAASAKLWQILGTGFDHFDLAYWREKKMRVSNCPGGSTGIPLAECALMFMLLLARRWHEVQQNLQKGLLYLPLGEELEQRRLGLVGFGASGRELARRARGFGMRISALDIRDISPEEQQAFGLDFAGKPADLDQLVTESDYLSLHLHLNAQTHHIIDDRRLRLMKPTARLINVARGALVDEKALYAALAEGRLGGAGLDVFGVEPINPDHPLFKLPNVVATPHVSGCTDGTCRRRVAMAAENCDRIAAGLEPLYRIDQ